MHARQFSMHCIPRIAHSRSLASCCDRIHLVGSSSGAIHPPGKSIHASKHPCTAIQSPKKQQRPLPSVLYIVRRNVCKRKHVQALQQRACSYCSTNPVIIKRCQSKFTKQHLIRKLKIVRIIKNRQLYYFPENKTFLIDKGKI